MAGVVLPVRLPTFSTQGNTAAVELVQLAQDCLREDRDPRPVIERVEALLEQLTSAARLELVGNVAMIAAVLGAGYNLDDIRQAGR